MADPEILNRLKALARERHTSLAEIIRQALEAKAAELQPRPRSLGIGASGIASTSAREATEPVPPRSWR